MSTTPCPPMSSRTGLRLSSIGNPTAAFPIRTCWPVTVCVFFSHELHLVLTISPETLSEAEVRRDLKRQEDNDSHNDDLDDDVDDAPVVVSPAGFVIMGLDIEQAQCVPLLGRATKY